MMMDTQITELLNKILNEPSYHPEKERKDKDQRQKELLSWNEKYEEINEFYNVWGLDCIDSPPADIYLDHGIFRKQRYEINSKFLCEGDSFTTNYTVIMRDKSLFEMFAAQTLGDTTKYVTSYALIKGKHFISHEGDYILRKADTFDKFVERHEGEKLVFKRSTGCSGKSVLVVWIENGHIRHNKETYLPHNFLESILRTNATWMIQPFIKQHKFMAGLNPDTVNIIRIVTFNTGNRTFAVPAMLVYSRGDTEVCNSDQGSYYVGININGTIEDKAIDRLDNKLVPCPVAGQKMPYWDEIIDLVCRLHAAIPELFTIGWDVTLTDNGPLIFEGNDGWCPYVNEWSPETALRATWDKAVEERKQYYHKPT